MIVSASRRTDIPAFYASWFMNRVRAGFCLVPNPFNPLQIRRVSLAPGDVDCVVFWSKDPRPLAGVLPDLEARGLRALFQFTLNGYGPALEPAVAPLAERLDTFRRLADRLGPRRVIWRYDPIVLAPSLPPSFHCETFARISRALSGSTTRVVISLVDFYRKTRRNLRDLSPRESPPGDPEIASLLSALKTLAASASLEITTCAEGVDFSPLGIPPGACIDGALLRSLGAPGASLAKDPGQRPACLCSLSQDIGVGDTCLHGCRYCYATRDADLARLRHTEHDPASPFLWQPRG